MTVLGGKRRLRRHKEKLRHRFSATFRLFLMMIKMVERDIRCLSSGGFYELFVKLAA